MILLVPDLLNYWEQFMATTPSDLPMWWGLSTETVDALTERTDRTISILRSSIKQQPAVEANPQADPVNSVDNSIAVTPSGGYSDEELDEICLDLHKKLYMSGFSASEIHEVVRKVNATRTSPFEITRGCIEEYLKEDPKLAIPQGQLTTSATLLVSNLFSTIMRQMRFPEADIVEVLGKISSKRRAPAYLSATAVVRFLAEDDITSDLYQADCPETEAQTQEAMAPEDFQMHVLGAFYRFNLRALGYPEDQIETFQCKVRSTNTAPKSLDKAAIEKFLSEGNDGDTFQVAKSEEQVAETPLPQGEVKPNFNYSVGNHSIAAGYNFAPRDVGQQPPVAFLMASLMAKTFGTRENVSRISGDAAVTFVTGVPLEYQTLAYEAVFEGKMLRDVRCSNLRAGYGRQVKIDGQLGTVEADGTFAPREQTILCVHGGDLKEHDANTIEGRRRGALNDMRIGLHNNTFYAMLAIVPDRSWLPTEIQTPLYKDVTYSFATMDRFVLAQAIGAAFCISPIEALQQLSQCDDLRIRALSIAEACFALHKPTAQEAIRALIDLLQDEGKKVTMADIAGMGEAQKYGNMILRDLEAWSKAELDWKDAVRSLLLYGEPGTGKTYMAQAMANSLPGVSFVAGSFGKWQSADKGHLGSFLKAMREDFDQAARSAPCILFIDEIDSIGSRDTKASDAQNSHYMRWAINGFLECLNGPDLQGVVVIGACNNPDALDPAILREGRMDLKAEVMLPGREAAAKILQTSLPEGFPIEDIIDFAIGLTPAVINGAVRKAKSESRLEEIELTPELVRKKLVPFPGKRDEIAWRVAVHEAGHVVVANHFTPGSVKRAVIGQTGGGAAHMDYVPNEGLIEDLENRIAVMMAGRAAEEIFTGKVSAGAGGSLSSDIAKATNMAIAIEARLGLGAEGLIYWDGKNHDWLDDTEARKRVQDRINQGDEVARRVIGENSDLLLSIAKSLKEKRVLDRNEIEAFYQ